MSHSAIQAALRRLHGEAGGAWEEDIIMACRACCGIAELDANLAWTRLMNAIAGTDHSGPNAAEAAAAALFTGGGGDRNAIVWPRLLLDFRFVDLPTEIVRASDAWNLAGDRYDDNLLRIGRNKTGTLATAGQGQLLSDPDDLTGAAWTLSSIPPVVTAPGTVEDVSTAQASAVRQDLTVASDANPHALLVQVRKASGRPNWVGIRLEYSGGTTTAGLITVNQETGVVGHLATFDSGTVTQNPELEDVWDVRVTYSNNNSGNTNLQLQLFPAWNSDGGVASDNTALGSAEFRRATIVKAGSVYAPILADALTTADDVAQLATAGWFNPVGFTAINEFGPLAPLADTEQRGVWSITDGTLDNRMSLRLTRSGDAINPSWAHNSGGGGAWSGAGGGQVDSAEGIVTNLHRVGLSAASGQEPQASIDGRAAEAAGGAGRLYTAITAADRLMLGKVPFTQAVTLGGYLRRQLVFDGPMPADLLTRFTGGL